MDLNARQTIDLAFLRSASPDTVYAWVKEHAPKESPLQSSIPDEVLHSLADRRHPLIDLALAEFCTSSDVLERLYRDGDEPTKCAVLTNRRLGDAFWLRPRFPGGEEQRSDLILNASLPLLQAYLSNPGIGASTLEDLFLRRAPFDRVDDDRWTQAVLFASDNATLGESPEEGGFPHDGFSWYQHRSAISAAWQLLDTVPATDLWADVLYTLYSSIIYAGPSGPEPETKFLSDLISKWKPASEAEPSPAWDRYGQLRKVVTSKMPIHGNHVRALLRDNEDRYCRLGYYAQFRPVKPPEIAAAFQRDGLLFLEAAIENDWFYRRGHLDARRALYQLLYSRKSSDGDDVDPALLLDRYRRLGEHYSESNPSEFEFEEDVLEQPEGDGSDSADSSRSNSTAFRATIAQFGEVVLLAAPPSADKKALLRSINALKKSLSTVADQIEQQDNKVQRQLSEFRTRFQDHEKLLLWGVVIACVVIWFTRS